MQPATEAMKFLLQNGQIDVQPRRQSKNRKIIAAGRRLNLAAIRAKEGGLIVSDGAGPAGNRDRILENFQHETAFTHSALRTVKILPPAEAGWQCGF
jgi:hypothetical protein